MQRFKHSEDWRPLLGRGFFRFWDRCIPCQHIQNYQVAHVPADRATHEAEQAAITAELETSQISPAWICVWVTDVSVNGKPRLVDRVAEFQTEQEAQNKYNAVMASNSKRRWFAAVAKVTRAIPPKWKEK